MKVTLMHALKHSYTKVEIKILIETAIRRKNFVSRHFQNAII